MVPRLSAALLLVTFLAQAADAQKLNRIRNEVRGTANSSKSSPKPTSSSGRSSKKSRASSTDHHYQTNFANDHHCSGADCDHCDDDDDQNGFSEAVSKGFFLAMTSPFWGPFKSLGDDGATGFFPDSPYENADGSLERSKAAAGFHDSLIILRGQYGNDFGGLSHANGRLILEHGSRWGIDTEFFYRYEDLPRGSDHLWTGDANLTYRFAQSEHWQFRTGIGVNWLSDRFGTEDGFNFTYGFEHFPVRPWVWTGDIDWGKIANAKYFHGRTTIGVTHQGFGVFTGYDFVRLGDVRLHTWINGIEYRF